MPTSARLSTGPNEDLVRELMNPTLQRDYSYFYRPFMAINRAHVVMLAEQAILEATDATAILRGLEAIEAELTPATLHEDLDLYFNVEHRLQAAIGPVAGRMHTARSRNDLQACYQRMAVRDRLDGLIGNVQALRTILLELAEAHAETVMPGYAHTQPAQPITFGHYLVSVHDAFARDEERLLAARRANFSPLGAGALAGTGFPIDRTRTAELLGFDGLVESTIDAVASRDYVVEALAACVGAASTASRMSADLIAWSAWEYRFVELADGYAAGSSIMPQKKNPLALEHTRAKVANVLAAYTAAATLTKGLPFTHTRDTGSEIFHTAFDGLAETGLVARVLAGVEMRTLTVHADRMAAAADAGYSTATELADTLVRRCGLPFRTAHDVVGAMVARTVGNAESASAWTVDQLRDVAAEVHADVSALSTDDLHAALDARHNVAVRNVVGGPAPSEVRRMLQARRHALTNAERALDGLRAQLENADTMLEARVAGFCGSDDRRSPSSW